MHYALYRQYRPQTFDETVGQEFITKTLKNQIINKVFAHAYLFTGTRGTGKTSCARILSRAINCLHTENGNPCNECEICKGLLDGSITDITEIDAASNNSVEDIRRMREEIVYLPVSTKYRVYIIDEVHMLTGSAFNALLKTLEEPPDHAVFILATTEAHKVPATILSRCQRFDFRRMSANVIASQINKILEKENKAMDPESVQLVAELGDGSMRDSLSVLEKVIGLSSYEEVESVLGVICRNSIYLLMDAVAEKNIPLIYSTVDDLYNNSKELSLLCNDLLREYRSLLLVGSVKEYRPLIDCSDSDCKQLEKLSAKYSSEHILYSMDILQTALSSMSNSSNKRADTEIALLKIAMPDICTMPSALLARIKKIESSISCNTKLSVSDTDNLSEPKVSPLSALPSVQKTSQPLVTERTVSVPVIVKKSTSPKDVEKKITSINHTADGVYRELMIWSEICDYVKEKNMLLSLTLRNECCAVYRNTDMIILCNEACDKKDINDSESLMLIKEAFEHMRKVGYTIRAEVGKKSDYIHTTELYDHAEESELFEFTDEI